MAKTRYVIYEEITPFPTWATILLLAIVVAVAAPMLLALQQQLFGGLTVSDSILPQLSGVGFSLELYVGSEDPERLKSRIGMVLDKDREGGAE